ncbi:MAG TPA: class I SAM-dependent methyltransferase [Oscillatoriaceae cyanobacterium]
MSTTAVAPQTIATGTQHEFGNEWDWYREILPMHEEQFRRWIQPLTPEFFAGKSFLDVGCGVGRNSYWPLKAGASRCLAIDYDERTVAVAKTNLASFENAEVRFQSVYELDLQNELDIAFSIGVIHHLADPRQAVERMVTALKPGGSLILWLYGHEGNERYLAVIDPLRRYVTNKLPPPATRWLARAMTVVLRGYLQLPHRKPYLQLLRQMTFRHLEAIVFDQLIPSIAHYWRKDEVEQLIAGLPLTNVRLTHTNGMSWTVVADKVS